MSYGPVSFFAETLAKQCSPKARPVFVFRRRRAWVAAYVCTAFYDKEGVDESVRRLHREAYETMMALMSLKAPTHEDLEDYKSEAQRVRDEVVAIRGDLGGTPMLIAVVQSLLCDAPHCCDRLNAAVAIAEREHMASCSTADIVLAEGIAAGVSS